jgi:hypothetical protein
MAKTHYDTVSKNSIQQVSQPKVSDKGKKEAVLTQPQNQET